MIAAYLFWVGLAVGAPLPFAGVPLTALPGLGLGAPDVLAGSDAWQAPAPGGWVRHHWSPDEAAAREAYVFQRATAVQATLLPVAVVGADEAVGDPGLVIARRANIVVVVRAVDAPALAAALLAAESTLAPPPGAAPSAIDADGIVRDPYGRRAPR